MNQSVCAVVVSFHPPQEDIANLAFIREQAQYAVVVDNGSDEIPLTNLRKTCRMLDIHLIENGANLGIAAALNTGIRWALSQGCKWVVLFDQDSKPLPGFVEKLLHALVDHPQTQKIAIMAPSYVDARSNAPVAGTVYTRAGEVLAVQSSGSLMPMAVFEKEGWFDENFFIDCVDYEYCLRIRNHGWIFEECKSAVLLHKANSPTMHKVLGHKFYAANFSPLRRYYRARNFLWMLRRYGKTHLLFCLLLNLANVNSMIKAIVAEDNRWEKLRSTFRGYVDGVWGNVSV
jgi:rhamnosyltransferase